MSHIIFDLDQCLVDTSALEPYRKTNPGRSYLQENLGSLDTRLYDSGMVQFVNWWNSRGEVSVLTNSPLGIARAILQKHGFDRSLPVYGSASKPDTNVLRRLMSEQRVTVEDCLMVGDRVLDILTGHEIEMCSVGVDWGGYNTREQLEMANPGCVVSSFDELQEAVEMFEDGLFEYEGLDLSGYEMLERVSNIAPNIKRVALGEYTPWGRGSFTGHSGKILRFKEAKDHTIAEINQRVKGKYFAGGRIRYEGNSYLSVMLGFIQGLEQAVAKLDPENTLIVAAPNSLPEFAYKSDIGRSMIRTAFKDKLRILPQRGIKRALPKQEAHIHGRTSESEHLATMGWNRELLKPAVRNVVIFDDIWTTGTQIVTMAKMLRELGIGRNYYALTLGETST